MIAKNSLLRMLDTIGLPIFEPFIRLATGDDPKAQLKQINRLIVIPIITFIAFLGCWHAIAKTIVTKYGTLPTPNDVWVEAGNLWEAHQSERKNASEYLAKQRDRAAGYREQADGWEAKAAAAGIATTQKEMFLGNAEKLRERAKKTENRAYNGAPTFVDQIKTSLVTVFTGFGIASLIAIPIGILCGLSKTFMAAVNPLIQIFKPVSPLAWLPIVMICVSALYTTDPKEAWFEKAFLSSAITVALCSLWPTLVNTALGVASIDKDIMNVAKVLKLGWWTQLYKIVLPASLPLMFTGLRISLGVGWMVLVAADMLAQNPGLGKFVWDMFQNGSSQTLAQIMVAVFAIGIIGFLLDRLMVVLQKSVSYDSIVSA